MNTLLHTARATCYKPTLRLLCARMSTQTDIKSQIESLVKDKKIVVFMKGTPDAPRCGFSNAVTQILKFHGVEKYESHDVLQNEDLRQGMKILEPRPRPNSITHAQ